MFVVVLPKQKYIKTLCCGESFLTINKGGLFTTLKNWYAEDMALNPSIYLNLIDPESGNFGLMSALTLWLDLDNKGQMDIGLGKSARELFFTEKRKYENA